MMDQVVLSISFIESRFLILIFIIPCHSEKGFAPTIMRFSIHLYICFQLGYREKSLGCPTNHGTVVYLC